MPDNISYRYYWPIFDLNIGIGFKKRYRLQGRRQKNSQGVGPTEKRPKYSKKDQKIAVLKHYLLHLFHV